MVWRERGAPGVSAGMYCIFIIGVALWFAYGMLLGAWPVIIANGVTLALASSVLAMKVYFDKDALRSMALVAQGAHAQQHAAAQEHDAAQDSHAG